MDSEDRTRRVGQPPSYSVPALHQQQRSSSGQSCVQQPPNMQTATPQSQYESPNTGGFPQGYNYHEAARASQQTIPPGFADQSVEYNRNSNVPRSPQSQYYQQGVQNMVYTMPPTQNYGYGWYNSVSPSQSRHFRPSASGELGVAQQSYYSSGVSTVSTPTMSISNTTTGTHENQYYTPVSQQTVTNSYGPFPQAHAGNNDDDSQGTSMDTSHPPDSPTAHRTAAFAKYHKILRKTLESAKDDRLKEAAQGLCAMSGELLGNVQRLGRNSAGTDSRTQLLTQPAGLVFDDFAQRDFRLGLWNNFNNAWLAVLQRQKDVSEAELSSGEQIESPKSRISRAYLQAMGDQLMNLCNDIDEWGLVDYEMGVWEEQIIDLLYPCLEIAVKLDKPEPGSGVSKTTNNSRQANQSATAASSTGSGRSKSPGAKRR